MAFPSFETVEKISLSSLAFMVAMATDEGDWSTMTAETDNETNYIYLVNSLAAMVAMATDERHASTMPAEMDNEKYDLYLVNPLAAMVAMATDEGSVRWTDGRSPARRTW